MRPMLPAVLLFALTPAALAADTGDLFVKVGAGQSGAIFIDGVDSGETTPATLEGLPAGNHMIQVKGDCVTAVKQIDVAPDKLTRVDLELKPMGSLIQIRTTPPTASVTLDRALQQNAGAGINAECGEHTIEVSAPGYIDQRREIDVDMGQVYEYTFTLYENGTGSLSVLVDPIDATVYLDGAAQPESGPVTVNGISAGQHLVGAELDGYELLEKTVTVEAGEDESVKLTLSKVGAIGSANANDGATGNTGDTSKERSINGKRLAGGGLALLGTGLVIGGVSSFSNAYAAYESAQNDLAPTDYDAAVAYYNDEAVPRARTAYALWAVGGIAIAGGGTLIFIDDAPVLGFSGRF